MDPLEDKELISKPTNPAKHNHPCQSPTKNNINPFSLLLQPFQWLHMLSTHLTPSFVIGVALVYGLGQGFSGSLFKVVTDYYWKDVQKVQPSAVQLYMGLYYIPWVMKPIWGLLTDVFPVRGYRRKPYFVVAGVLGGVSALMVALLGNLPVVVALICLIVLTAGMAIADVTIDACIATNSIECRELAPDMQSLCWFCSSAGALVGYSTSGVLVHHLGAQAAFSILAVPPALFIVLGFVIHESKAMTTLHPQKKEKTEALESLGVAVTGMYESIKCPQVWKPSLYMFLSLALSISTHEAQFYWYTDPKDGPAFSQEFVGVIYAIGAAASMAGLLIYHKTLKDYPFRHILFFVQLLFAACGMLDLIFVLRWNLALGIPDYFFIVAEECVVRIITRIRWMPMMVLSSRLCPLGIEGTFYALLTGIDSLGSLSSKWGGGFVMHLLNVTRTDFRNLWLIILIRNILRFSTLCFIFLIPNADHSEDLIPLDILKKNSAANVDDDDDDEQEGMLQLVIKKEKLQV
ncbi:Major facilitator superfamily protein [Tripterygium wilfordii]|uniref:Major facilitator superfamily protein n=1 Tax=Tripterygium wilfordii TaxID=458696 RepID=A0A7J7DP32_TRIWF|nr:probable folate-biopterin transporter 6 [Tripterygium wilfordii]KAF5748111.1 Major facilitator superfamily protein [Tripterygium wilfordii]